jgi:LuxR family maltose regulon positive regulatory protein
MRFHPCFCYIFSSYLTGISEGKMLGHFSVVRKGWLLGGQHEKKERAINYLATLDVRINYQTAEERERAFLMLESDLVVTKFTIPPQPAGLLPREQLRGLLDQSRPVPLTLLAAPAGFGKTTLLAAWASQQPGQVAWLSLEEQDNDLARFWVYVIAALRHSGTLVGETALALLHSLQPSLVTNALTSFINELAGLARDTYLVLDDYHLIREPAIHESLKFLLEHLPPCLHLFITSRSDPKLPLARFRARGQLVEIREPDLRLKGPEAALFLTQFMGLGLTKKEIDCLEERTEGWLAGLQLAALSVRRHADSTPFIEALDGSHGFITDYVQEEILASLSEAQQWFLLQTSVLTRLNAGLCQALTGEQASQQMLESLERARLFLVPLDEKHGWYRFHALFREALLARLEATQPEEVVLLHRKAALWYRHHQGPHEAIQHALATQDFFFVASLLEGWVERLYLQGELKTLLAWLKMLPKKVLLAHPRLATSYILAFNMMFPFSHQEPEERAYLHQLREEIEVLLQSEDQAALSEDEWNRMRQRIFILKGWNLAVAALSEGNVEQLTKAGEGMQYGLDDDTMWQQHRLAPLALAWRMAGNFPPMVAALQEGRKLTWKTQNRYQEIQTLWGLIAGLVALGQLRSAQEHCQQLQALVNCLGGPLPVAAYPDLFQAQLAYEWNQLDVAKNAAQSAIEKTAPLHYMDILVCAYEVFFRVCLAQNDLTGAEQAAQAMEAAIQTAGIPLFRPWLESVAVNLWLARGELPQAVDWAEHTVYHQENISYSREKAYLALVRVYLVKSQYAPALELLATLLSRAEQVNRVESMISILALQVVALHSSGNRPAELCVLRRLLSLAEPERYIRVFLDAGRPMQQALHALLTTAPTPTDISPTLTSYAMTVFDAFACEQRPALQPVMNLPVVRALPGPSAQAGQSLLEPLTLRESEVLPLLAEGASNQEIADQLVVSLATAKKHVANILSKLGAENRTQAIAYARSLSLV